MTTQYGTTDSETGKWMSPDPMGDLDGPNLYVYCRNNPLAYVDYFGLASEINPNCGCVNHDHPGWENAPERCVCICEKGILSKRHLKATSGGDVGTQMKSGIGKL